MMCEWRQVPRGKWLCSLCHVKSPAKKKPPAKKSRNSERVSESESLVAEEASSCSIAIDATPPASVAAPSPRRSSSAAGKRAAKDSQASAKDKDLAPCRYKG